MRIGILGGTFDPIHNGHLKIAASAANEMNLNKVLFIPTGHPPHKPCPFANGMQRIEMVRMAIKCDSRFEACDMEVFRTGTTYTVDTLKELTHRSAGKDSYFYIIGSDTLAVVDLWRDFASVTKLCAFIAVMRPGDKEEDAKREAARLSAMGAQIHLLHIWGPPVSSSEIKQRAAEGRSFEGLLPQDVGQYVLRCGFYQKALLRDRIDAWLKVNISPDRYAHILGVEHTSVNMAMHYGADTIKASFAALLHDCAKEFEAERLHKYAFMSGEKIDEIMNASPFLLHAVAGSVFAKIYFGVDDEDVLFAVKSHIFGRPQMTLLEKIIFLADFIEPGRTYEGVEELRRTAFSDIDTACMEASRDTLIYSLARNKLVHPQTLLTYNSLILERGKDENGRK